MCATTINFTIKYVQIDMKIIMNECRHLFWLLFSPLFLTLLLLFFQPFLSISNSFDLHLFFFFFNLQLLPLAHFSSIHSMFCLQKSDYSLSFSILFFLLVDYFILSCTFALGWFGMVLCFLIFHHLSHGFGFYFSLR